MHIKESLIALFEKNQAQLIKKNALAERLNRIFIKYGESELSKKEFDQALILQKKLPTHFITGLSCSEENVDKMYEIVNWLHNASLVDRDTILGKL